MGNSKPLPFSLQDWSRLQINFDRRGRTIWSSGQHTPYEWFDRILIDFTFWFFFQGNGELISSDGHIYPLRAGTCLCMTPGMRFAARQTGSDLLGDSYFHLNFSIEGKPLSLEQWPILPLHSEVVDINFFSQVTNRILRLLNDPLLTGQSLPEMDRLEAEYLMKGLLLELLRNEREVQHASRAGLSRHQEKIVSQVLSALSEDPTRFSSVSQMASLAGYSVSHFRALCHTLTGRSPSDMLIHTRIERAKDYLLHSDLTVSMIADQLGYENVHYFSRQFKAVTGQSPTTFRFSQ